MVAAVAPKTAAVTKHDDINNAALCYPCAILPFGRKTMRKLQIEDAGVMRIAIQQEIARSEESRYDHRLHGVLLVSQGLSCCHVAEYFGENPVTVQRWVRRFNDNGFAGLFEGERSGRPSRLSGSQWARLEK